MQPRFTLPNLFEATMLVAVGLLGIDTAFRCYPDDRSLLFSFVGGGCIDAGLFVPFKCEALGAAIGLMIQLGVKLAVFS